MMADPEAGPPEMDAPFLKFHQLTQLKIYDDKPEKLSPEERLNLLAVSNEYGYTFVGCNSAIKVLKTSEISKCYDQNDPHAASRVTDYSCSKVELIAKPVHLALNADNLVLSVCTMTETSLMVTLFDVRTLVHKSTNASPFSVTTLSKEPNIQLVNLLWNPTHPCCFATCLSDGSMALWDSSGDSIVRAVELPMDVHIKAMCWSPKGKQIVLGTSNGELVQFNQKLEIKRTIQPPDFSEDVKVVDILWLSTYMFAVAYIDADETLQPNLTIVKAPKEGQPTFTNFEDICFGNDQLRTAQYQLQNFDKWSFLVAVSSNAVEAAVMGRSPDDSSVWEVWTVDDASRIELPLTGNDKETFPMGMALDLTSESTFEMNNKKYHSPPMLMVLSTEGVLCPFYVLNSDASEVITAKAQPLPPEGERIGKGFPTQPQVTKPAPPAVSAQPLQAPSKINPQVPPQAAHQVPPQAAHQVPPQAAHQFPPQTPPETPPPDRAKPVSVFTASAPIHKSSSTGCFPFGQQSTSATSASCLIKPSQPDRSASFTFSSSKQPATTTSPSTFGIGGLFGKSASSSSNPVIFSFGSKVDTGSAVGTTPFPLMAPKAVPASTSLSQGDSQGLTEQGKLLQQPSSAYTTSELVNKSLFSASPQATRSSVGAGPQQAVGLSSDHLKSQYPPSASSSAFSLSQQKMPAETTAFSGGVQSTDSVTVKDTNSSPSLKTTPGKAPLGPEPKTSSFSFAPPNQVASQAASQFGGAPPNRVAPQSGYPNQVAPSGEGVPFKQQGPPAYPGFPPNQVAPQPGYSVPSHSTAKQQPGQAHPDYKPTPSVQARPPEAVAVESGPKPKGKASFTGSAVDLAYFSNIKEEMEHFIKEIVELDSHTRRAHFKVGDRSELEEMKKFIDDLLKFNADVQNITKSDNEEIHEIKTKFLSTFAQLEDARIRKQRNNDPRYLQLLKSRGLDPQTAQQLRNIHSNYHYLKTGLGDVSSCLDAQWEEFNERKSRREGRKLGTPMMDTIYQTLSHHYNILITQRGKLEELRQQLIQARRYDMSEAPWERGILPSPPDRSGNLSSLAAKLSSTTISSPTTTRSTPVSSKKQAQLRKALSRRVTTPRRTASKMNMSDMSSPIQSYASPSGAFANRRLQFQDEEPVETPTSSRQTTYAVDRPDAHTGRGFNQARLGGSLERVAPSSQLNDEKQPESSRNIERKAAAPYVSPHLPVEKPPSSNPALPETTSPSSFIHSGRGTVVWGTKTTPIKTPPSMRVSSAGAIPKRVNEKSSDLPQVVNVKNIDAMKESMPPPVTFAPVCSTIDEGTAKVINQVLAEITNTSGYFQPESSDQNERRVSFSIEPPPIAQPVPPSKPLSLVGASKTPALQPTAPGTSATPPTTNVGLTFGAQGSLFGAKRDGTSTAASDPTPSGSATSKGTLPSFPGLPSGNVTASKPGLGVAESATFGSTSSGFALTSLQQNASPAGVKPNLFDFKDQRTAASTSTPGAFFVASANKEPSQDPADAVNVSGSSSAPTDTAPFKSSQQPSFGVKSIVTAPPSTSVVEPTATVAAVPAFGSSFSQASAKPFPAAAPKATSSGSSELKQLLQGGEDEAGTGLAKTPSSEGGQTTNIQAYGEDVADIIKSNISTSDVTDHPTPATSSVTFSTSASAAPTTKLTTGLFGKPSVTAASAATTTTSTAGLFGKPSVPPVEGSTSTAGLFGSMAGGTSMFGATSSTSTSSAPTASFGNPSFGSAATFGKAPSTGPFGAQQFGAPSSGFSFAPSSTPATTTSTAPDTAKTKTPALFGLLKEDPPTSSTATSSSSLFGSSTTSGSTAAKSLFSQPTSTSTSPFGQPASSSSGLFGQSASMSISGVGPFGSSTSTTSSSGVAFAQASSASPFQQSASSGPFGSDSTFGQQQSSGGLFGQKTTSAPVFGQSPSLFAQSSAASPTSSLFGGAGGDGGGGFFSSLGGQPNPEAARTNPFGSPSTLGTSTGNTSIFGGQGATSFSSGSTAASTNSGSVFGGGFSSPSGGVAKAGFGVTQQTTAFGGTPSFGSPPAFGSAPSFGSSTFGSTAEFSGPFGQPSSFGATSNTSTSSAPSNGFTGFASQDTPTFGSLSSATNQQTQPNFGGFGGGGTGFGGGFGGNTNAPAGGTGFGGNTNAPAGGTGFGGNTNAPAGGTGFGGNTSTSSEGFNSSNSFMQYR